MTAKGWWIGRPVEVPGSCPLEFDPRNGMGLPLQSWPSGHVVKCLLFYHPDDPLELRLAQERRVRELYADCVELDRELLLEIIVSSKGQRCEDETIPNVLRRFYNLGVCPSWWKLEPQTHLGWKYTAEVIERYDPLCRGVLLLGLDASLDELTESFQAAAAHPVCKGFAVGRSIFGDAARQWFNNDLDDEGVVSQVSERYQATIRIWKQAAAELQEHNRAGSNSL
jgi:5-dehydro-2-deoxygluconokinase